MRNLTRFPILFIALLALSLGACQKKDETPPMPETGGPSAPAPGMVPPGGTPGGTPPSESGPPPANAPAR